MTKFKSRPLLSLLLALVLVVTMLPTAALAAEIPEAEADAVYDLQPDTEPEVCTDEGCTHELEAEEASGEIPAPTEAIPPEVETTPEAEEIADAPAVVPEDTPTPDVSSPFAWEIESDGTLYITGSGYVEPFCSADDQPWRDEREQIFSVRFDLSASLQIYDLCYWFDGCSNLSDVAIPVYVAQICPDDFAGCSMLCGLTYGGVDVLAEITADYDNQPVIEPELETAPLDDGISLFSASSCGVTSCTCTGSCSWGYRNYRVAPESNAYHIMTVYCATCGRTDGIIVSGSHSFRSNGYCSLCGYYNSAYDTTICYHTSTYTTWVTNCRWEKYCSSCGAYVSSGVSHGPYTYGSWQYYSASQHRRSYTCSYGDSGTYYEYGNHSATTTYGQYSAAQHSVSSYCSTCGTTLSTSYANHSFSYGAWQSYSDTQHRRTASCSACSYSNYDYGAHSDADSDGNCDSCGYEMSRFSVTLPASLSLTVSEHGEVYAATNAAIINNSTGAVEITGLNVSAANGWTLVPYSFNMAQAKVDAKQIGFSVNGAATANSGESEAMSLPGNWTIAKGGALPLSYGAVISAMSQPVSEQVLTVVFVLEWAGK